MNKTHEYNNNFKEEYKKAIQFLKKGCKCGCSKKVPKEKFAKRRAEFQSLPKIGQDIYVMADLNSMNEGETTTSSRFPKKERTNKRTFYRWNNKTPICLETYLNMLGISHTYLEWVRSHLINKGLTARIHSNIGNMPQWATKMTIDENIKKKIKKFLEKYAQEHGQPDPSQKYARKIAVEVRTSGKIFFLPTEMSYKSVHHDFIISVGENSNLKSLKYEAFRRLWHELTPNIKFMKPRTDLCDNCHKFKNIYQLV